MERMSEYPCNCGGPMQARVEAFPGLFGRLGFNRMILECPFCHKQERVTLADLLGRWWQRVTKPEEPAKPLSRM